MKKIKNLLYDPKKLLLLLAAIVFGSLLFDGTLLRLWKLERERSRLVEKMQADERATEILQVRILEAKDPRFLKKHARERFDMLAEDELVFIFAGDL